MSCLNDFSECRLIGSTLYFIIGNEVIPFSTKDHMEAPMHASPNTVSHIGKLAVCKCYKSRDVVKTQLFKTKTKTLRNKTKTEAQNSKN